MDMGDVGQVINGDVGNMKVLLDRCVEAAEQYIHNQQP